jgi:hypothetical protein
MHSTLVAVAGAVHKTVPDDLKTTVPVAPAGR